MAVSERLRLGLLVLVLAALDAAWQERPGGWPRPLLGPATWPALWPAREALAAPAAPGDAPAPPQGAPGADGGAGPVPFAGDGGAPAGEPEAGEGADAGTGPFWEGATWARFKARVAAGEKPSLRVVHLGDSEIAGDMVATRIRKVFRERLGDGGPGFVFVAKPYPYYHREGFRVPSPDGFAVRTVADGKPGQVLGLAGMAFRAEEAGASLVMGLDEIAGPCSVRFLYLMQPRGGKLSLSADGKPLAPLSTAAPFKEPVDGTWTFEKCPRKLGVRVESLPATLYGWEVSRAGGGITWSPIGIVSSSAALLDRKEQRAHLVKSLATLEPDLLVVSYGLNVVGRGLYPKLMSAEVEHLGTLLAATRAGLPDAACVVMTPYPIGSVAEDQPPQVNRAVALLAGKLRPVALGAGCSFLDREALAGGAARALEWSRAKPKLLSADGVHLTQAGADLVGEQVGRLLLERGGVP